jgi:hypothetical protein
MAKSKTKEDKPQTIVIVYPRNTIEITMPRECAEQLLAAATKRDRLTDSCEFTGEDIHGRKFRVQVGGSSQAVYARSQEPNAVTLPGNSTKTDLVEIMKMAAGIVRDPARFTSVERVGCAVALDQFVVGVN